MKKKSRNLAELAVYDGKAGHNGSWYSETDGTVRNVYHYNHLLLRVEVAPDGSPVKGVGNPFANVEEFDGWGSQSDKSGKSRIKSGLLRYWNPPTHLTSADW